MCNLCGILSGRGHWTDPSSHPEAFEDRTSTHTWHRERQTRTALTNQVLAHYGLNLADWGGHAYVLKSRTGQTAIVENMSELWPAAEQMIGRPCDPLGDDLLDRLAG